VYLHIHRSIESLSRAVALMSRLACFMHMPGTITKLEIQKKNKERVNVYLDDEFAFGLALIEALKLKRGQVLSDDEIERLRELDEAERAHERALHFLSYRPRSEDEVRRNLKSGKFSSDAIEGTLERLKTSRLVDDRAFVQYWLENRGQFKPLAARALKYELRQKGIAADLIDEVLQSVEFDEEEAAYQAALPRARRLAGLTQEEFEQKLGAFLGRRGFGYEVARDAVRRAWDTIHADAPADS
jgi:regulatory protein